MQGFVWVVGFAGRCLKMLTVQGFSWVAVKNADSTMIFEGRLVEMLMVFEGRLVKNADSTMVFAGRFLKNADSTTVFNGFRWP